MDDQTKVGGSWLHARLRHICGSYLSLTDIRWILTDKLNTHKQFLFNNHPLEYFFHSYNNFRLSERTIEIPIIEYFLSQGDYREILEIGNVTNNYYDYFRPIFSGKNKTVVDKFERAPGVINLDIADYAPAKKFDFVLSISTFEHMDSDRGTNPDYVEGSSQLVSMAADNIKHVSDALLQDGGKFIVTAPIGYTPEWDRTFYSDAFEKCNFRKVRKYLVKRRNELVWEQTDEDMGQPPAVSWPSTQIVSIVEFEK